jgi:hypothetical protein
VYLIDALGSVIYLGADMSISAKAVEVFFVSLISFLPAPAVVDGAVRPYAQTTAAIVTVVVGVVQLSDRYKKAIK